MASSELGHSVKREGAERERAEQTDDAIRYILTSIHPHLKILYFR